MSSDSNIKLKEILPTFDGKSNNLFSIVGGLALVLGPWWNKLG